MNHRDRIDLGPWPPGARSVQLEVRREGRSRWRRLGVTTERVSWWRIPRDAIELRAVVRDLSGKLHRPGVVMQVPTADEDERSPWTPDEVRNWEDRLPGS